MEAVFGELDAGEFPEKVVMVSGRPKESKVWSVSGVKGSLPVGAESTVDSGVPMEK